MYSRLEPASYADIRVNIQCCVLYHSLGNVCFELGDREQSCSYCIKAIQILLSDPDIKDRKAYLAHLISLFERIRKRAENMTKESSSSIEEIIKI